MFRSVSKKADQAAAKSYTSITIDGSHDFFEDNIAVSKAVVDICKNYDVQVEAKLGKVGGKEDDLNGGEGDGMTDPSQAAEFAERTGVDSLAIAIGTANSIYKGEPHVDVNRLAQIRKVVDITLVLHGTSGVPDDVVCDCVANGICKVNYETDLRIAFSNGLKSVLKENPDVFDPKKYDAAGREYVQKYVEQKMDVVGSTGRA